MELQEFMKNNTPYSLFNIMTDKNQTNITDDFIINFTHNLIDEYIKKELILSFDFSNEIGIINIKSAIYKVIDKYKTCNNKDLTNFNQEMSRAVVTTIFDLDNSNRTSYNCPTVKSLIAKALNDISKNLKLDKEYIIKFPLSNECYADIFNAYMYLSNIKFKDCIGTILYDMVNNENFCHEFKQEFETRTHIHNIILALYNDNNLKILFIDKNNIEIKCIQLNNCYDDYNLEVYKLMIPKMSCSNQLIVDCIKNMLICDTTTVESLINSDAIGTVIKTYYFDYMWCYNSALDVFKKFMLSESKLTEFNNLLKYRNSVGRFAYQHGDKEFKFLLYRSNYCCIWYIGDNDEILKYKIENGYGVNKVIENGINRLIDNKLEGNIDYIAKSMKTNLHFKISQAASAITNGDLSKLTNFKFKDIVNYLKNDMDFKIKSNEISEHFIFSQSILNIDVVKAYDVKSDTFYKNAFDYVNEDISLIPIDDEEVNVVEVINRNKIFLANCALNMLMKSTFSTKYKIPRNFFKLMNITYVKRSNFIRFQFGLKSDKS